MKSLLCASIARLDCGIGTPKNGAVSREPSYQVAARVQNEMEPRSTVAAIEELGRQGPAVVMPLGELDAVNVADDDL